MRHDDRPRWHPILSAHEHEPGVWSLVDTSERHYATIRILRRDGEVAYRGEAEPSKAVLGYWRRLADACSAVHGLWVGRGTPGAPEDRRDRGDAWGPRP